MKNWLGLERHPSDQYLHWTDSIKDALELRKVWDAIPENLWVNVKFLMDQVYNYCNMDHADGDAGEAL